MIKHQIIVGLLVAITTLLFTGCATGPKFTAAPAPQPGNALIYIYRKGSIVGAANSPNIYVNNKLVAHLTNGGYATCEVPQGTVGFDDVLKAGYVAGNLVGAALVNSIDKPKEKLQIDVEAGKTYYIRWHLTGGALTVEDEATGLNDISGLHLVTP